MTGVVEPQGTGVMVDGFAADGRWAHISAPVEGWISNDFASPTGSETELATLVADQIAVVLGIATDGSRLRIAAPVSGWISSTVVQR